MIDNFFTFYNRPYLCLFVHNNNNNNNNNKTICNAPSASSDPEARIMCMYIV